MKPLICKLCGFYSQRAEFKKHIKEQHNIETNEYFKNIHFGVKVGECLNCSKEISFTTTSYKKYCNNKCQNEYRYKNETLQEKEERRKKLSDAWVEEKRKKQSKKHVEINKLYDREYYHNRQLKLEKTKEERYGDKHYNNQAKMQETCLERYGVDNIRKSVGFYKTYNVDRVKKVRQTCLKKYGTNWIPYKPRDNNIPKRIETCLERYGADHYAQSVEHKTKIVNIVQKIWSTKKKNGTTNTSQLEIGIYNELRELYPEFTIIKEYKSKEYPFSCDFYIKELDFYIEVQGFFTHGFKSFEGSKEDKELLKKWKEKAKNSTFYKNAIYIWTKKDVEKRKWALKNKLHFLEIFTPINIEQQIKNITKLKIEFSDKELQAEINKIKETPGNIKARPTHNKLVKHFQSHFFEEENKIYKNPIKRRQLIQNRMKYLNKKEHELTVRELLSGFKISGIYQGFSFFSPLWFKYFIENEDVESTYDPFGGWGHRLLGTVGTNLEKYIYNDLSTRTYTGVKQIYDYIDTSTECIFYNEDSLNFIPDDNFDSIFTCPPYDDLEAYDNNSNFVQLMVRTGELFELKNVKTMGVIIREDLLTALSMRAPDEEIELNVSKSHFNKKNKKEKLYIWRKK